MKFSAKILLVAALFIQGIFAVRGMNGFTGENELTDSALLNRYFYLLQPSLKFPNTTGRFYVSTGFQPAWFNSDEKAALQTKALLLLDCVLQYGLKKSDYHPEKLSFTRWAVLEKIGSREEKISFDILLTDAIITFIEQLHFGFANPYLASRQADDKNYSIFRADAILLKAVKGDFNQVILSVQPQHPSYTKLQNYMRLVVGQYSGDCYEFNNDSLRLIALNLERYRWMTPLYSEPYVEVNIPSFTLQLQNYGNSSTFKVIVGKPASKTPQLGSKIYSLSTAPEWNVPHRIFINELLPRMLEDPAYVTRNNYRIYTQKGKLVSPEAANLREVRRSPEGYFLRQSYGEGNSLGQIVFHFNNPYHIHLHDTPNRSLFRNSYRALSHGCIRLENPRKFAAELLAAAGTPTAISEKVLRSMDSYKPFKYHLIRPVPIIIHYITCSVDDGVLRKYADPYNLDKVMIDKYFRKVNFLPVSEMMND